jgi:hypothetical protein
MTLNIMKKILFLFAIAALLTQFSCQDDPFAEVKELAPSEIIYPEKFDTISAAVGFERAEIYLTKAGRSDSLQKHPRKAKKTIVEYNNGRVDTTIVFDGMKTWVNVTGLTLPKLYRFRVYTIDSLDNKSVYQEVAVIPFTSADRDAIRIADPNSTLSPWGVKLWWPNGISTDMWKFLSCDYEYLDKDANPYQGIMDTLAPLLAFDAVNLAPGADVNISFTIKVIPIVKDVPILDTVSFAQNIEVVIPTETEYGQFLTSREIEKWETDGEQVVLRWKNVSDPTLRYTTVTYTDYSIPSSPVQRIVTVANTDQTTLMPGLSLERFSVSSSYEPVGGEGAIVDAQAALIPPEFYSPESMAANGITRNTDPLTVTSLTFPIHTKSLIDMLYFPNLTEVDLRGTGIPIPPQSIRSISTIGGCPWDFSMRRRDLETSEPRELTGRQALSKLLLSGQLTKVYYNQGSMGSGIDAIMSIYAPTGKAEITYSPPEVFLSNNFYVQGTVVSDAWKMDVTYQPSDPPEGDGGAVNIWKVILRDRSASFCVVYQKDYKFNFWDYPFLKMKVYTPDPSYFSPYASSRYHKIWFRLRNSLWGHTPLPSWDGNNDEQNAGKEDFPAASADFGNWRNITVDIRNKFPNLNQHPFQNSMVINVGGEPSTWPGSGGEAANPWPKGDPVFYFADIRFSKTP